MSTPLRLALRMVSAAMSMTVSAPARVGDVEADLVAADGDQGGAFDSLVLGEVRKCHASNLRRRARSGQLNTSEEGTCARRLRLC
jgi:hypothetical protein